MSTPSDNNKIVDLQQRQASALASQDRVGDLLKVVRGTALKRVQGLVSTLFENIDDALFDLAEKAENNAIQTQYFDGMREVRKKRQLVERLFQDQLSKIFNEFAAGKMQAKSDSPVGGNAGDLSLVDDKELEESLAIASTVAKAENRLSRPLYAVNQRLSVLLGGAKVEDCDQSDRARAALSGVPFRHARDGTQSADAAHHLQAVRPLRHGRSRWSVRRGQRNPDPGRRAAADPPHRGGTRRVVPRGRCRRAARCRRGVPQDQHGQPIPDPAAYGGYGQAYGSQYDQAAAQLQAEIYNTVRNLLASRRPDRRAARLRARCRACRPASRRR